MDHHDEDDALLSSQIIEEEDLLFDDGHSDQQLLVAWAGASEHDKKLAQHPQSDDTLRVRLAGPSTSKAGLEAVDKAKVNEIIYEASKGSSFFENERKRDEAVTGRINTLLAKYEKIKNDSMSEELVIVDNMVEEMEKERDLTQYICHIDMDAFYASVEELDQPHLKTVPMAVGGIGMLCTSNYEARKYGVRSAMPGYIALKLCPHLKIVPLNFAKYRAASAKVRSIFEQYDPHYCPMSLDEAYLDITNHLRTTNQSPPEIVLEIRNRIFNETRLTASAGIAANKMLAKMCTDVNKPNGQFYLKNELADIKEFVNPLSIRKIPGVGRVTERVLNALNVKTCQDIYPQRAMLFKLLSDISFKFLLRAHLGLGSTMVDSEYVRKSISVERTFRSLSSRTDLYFKLKDIAQKLAKDLESKNLCGKTIGLKIKLTSFEVRTRAKTLPVSIYKQEDLEKYAGQLLEKELPVSLRLMGIRLSSLSSRDEEDHKGVKRFFHPISDSVSKDGEETYPSKRIRIEEEPPVPQIEDLSNLKDDKSAELALCPICNTQFQNLDNRLINEHIDSCLNMSLVRNEMQMTDVTPYSNSSGSHTSPATRLRKDNHTQLSSSKSLRDYFDSSNHT
ncbi:hypothetical protein BGW37DRAFT_6820 [Umbelopsis sp. PMI_123]|nr:hypothetical protein BGW37DRAFT_6820 [Umbelopsis sp. PMI_123]